MKSLIDEFLARWLIAWVDAVRRHDRRVVVAILLASIPIATYAALELEMNSDSVSLVGRDLPARKNHDAFAALFPNLENALLIVVDGETPELTRSAAEALEVRLAADREHFTEVYLPGGGEFFERNALLYRSVDNLERFADQMARIQPLLAELERDPSIGNLTSLVREGLDQARRENSDVAQWTEVLDRVGAATISVYDEYPIEVSWEELLLRGSAIEAMTRRVVIVHPILDFSTILSASESLSAIRLAASELGLSPERGVRVRVTGNPVLNYEEMIGLAWDIGGAGIFCFLLVAFILNRALRSLRLVAAAILTLLVGLVWTAAFATASVGHLNIISMAFGILFIGLGVDFAIHLGMRYSDLLRGGLDHEAALRESVRSVGSSLVICSCTTAIGFFVFVPTNYLGVAELGLIAGGGMLVILFLTLTLFPALIGSWLRVDPARDLRGELTFRQGWSRFFAAHPRWVRGVALLLAILGIVLIPRARFDANAVALRDPGTESVQTFDDLLAESGASSPWFVNAVAKNLEEADALAARLESLDVVENTITLNSYIPQEQEEKLEILADVAFLLDPTGAPPSKSGKATPVEEQIASLRELHQFLAAPWIDEIETPLAESMRRLRSQLGLFLGRLDEGGDPGPALAMLERLLLASLPDQVTRLRLALSAEPIDADRLPPELRRRMVASNGAARVQAFPSEDLREEGPFERFADRVREVEPRATGISVNLLEFGRACQEAFRQALGTALLVIGALLWLLWRNLWDTVLVLAPLLLASILTVASMVLLDMPFHFVNLIVIPLLFGIGVDSGVHLVHRAKGLEGSGEKLLETTTARAVYYSALTTMVSFGSLAFSSHRGMESLGIVLLLGMALTVACNLIVLPALISLRKS